MNWCSAIKYKNIKKGYNPRETTYIAGLVARLCGKTRH